MVIVDYVQFRLKLKFGSNLGKQGHSPSETLSKGLHWGCVSRNL